MKYILPAVIVFCILGTAAVLFVVVKDSKTDQDKIHKLELLCTGSKMAMEEDYRAFIGSDEKKREIAYERFYEGDVIYHSAASLQYCLDVTKLPSMPAECQLNKDWPCLANLAKKIGEML